MNTEYDIFEILPDNSTMWRACAQGSQRAFKVLNALGNQTSNACFAIDLNEKKIIATVNDIRSTPQSNTYENQSAAD